MDEPRRVAFSGGTTWAPGRVQRSKPHAVITTDDLRFLVVKLEIEFSTLSLHYRTMSSTIIQVENTKIRLQAGTYM